MKKTVYYRESRWWDVIWGVLLLTGFLMKSITILFVVAMGLFIVTIIQNETKPIDNTQKKPKRC